MWKSLRHGQRIHRNIVASHMDVRLLACHIHSVIVWFVMKAQRENSRFLIRHSSVRSVFSAMAISKIRVAAVTGNTILALLPIPDSSQNYKALKNYAANKLLCFWGHSAESTRQRTTYLLPLFRQRFRGVNSFIALSLPAFLHGAPRHHLVLKISPS